MVLSVGAVDRGTPAESLLGGWKHQLVPALSIYPGSREYLARVGYRYRLLSLPPHLQVDQSFLHLYLGVGVFASSVGPAGPRIELKGRAGDIAWGGVFVSGAYKVEFPGVTSAVELAIGVDAPLVWF